MTQVETSEPSTPSAASVDVSGALERIRAMSPSLNRSEARVARTILADPTGIVLKSVTEIAAEAGTSISTVVRCCQSLGFQGFQDMKIALARESIPPLQRIQGDIAAGDSAIDVLHKVFSGSEVALRESGATIRAEPFAAAIDAMLAATRILFVGVGTSAPLAQDAAYRFLSIGLQAEAPADVHVQHVVARLLDRSDVCVAVSHTGSTRETLSAVKAAKEANATVIAVTSFQSSPLTKESDIAVVAGSRETSFRMEAMASRVAHLCVLDAMFVAVALARQEDSTKYLDITANVLSEHRY